MATTVQLQPPPPPHSPDHFCKDCGVMFESVTSLEVHLSYHKENLLSKWGSQPSNLPIMENKSIDPAPSPRDRNLTNNPQMSPYYHHNPPQIGPDSISSNIYGNSENIYAGGHYNNFSAPHQTRNSNGEVKVTPAEILDLDSNKVHVYQHQQQGTNGNFYRPYLMTGPPLPPGVNNWGPEPSHPPPPRDFSHFNPQHLAPYRAPPPHPYNFQPQFSAENDPVGYPAPPPGQNFQEIPQNLDEKNEEMGGGKIKNKMSKKKDKNSSEGSSEFDEGNNSKGKGWKGGECKRPKTYNCVACNKWFTSSGHLKRHYGTTLHKNSVKQKGENPDEEPPPPPRSKPNKKNSPSEPSPSPPQPLPESQPKNGHAENAHKAKGTNGHPSNSVPPKSPSPPKSNFRPNNDFNPEPHIPPPQYAHSPNGGLQNSYMSPFGNTMGQHAGHNNFLPQFHYGHPPPPPHGPNGFAHSVPPDIYGGTGGIGSYNGYGGQIEIGGGAPLPSFGSMAFSHYDHHQNFGLQLQRDEMRRGPYPNEVYFTHGAPSPHSSSSLNSSTNLGVENMDSDSGIHSSTGPLNTESPEAASSVSTASGLSSDENSSEHNEHINIKYCYKQENNREMSSNNRYINENNRESNEDIIIKNNSYNHDNSSQDNGEMDYAPTNNNQSYSLKNDIKNNGEIDNSHNSYNHKNNGEIVSSSSYSSESNTGYEPTHHNFNNNNIDENGGKITSITGENVLKCTDCSKTFNRTCYLTQHTNSSHSAGNKPFKCLTCGKKFTAAPALDEHMAKHGSNKPYKCDLCPKQFNHKTDLRRHRCLHTGEKPFSCNFCGKGFIRKDHMTKHTETHRKVKATH